MPWEKVEDLLQESLGDCEERAGCIHVDFKSPVGLDYMLPMIDASKVSCDYLEFWKVALDCGDLVWAGWIVFGGKFVTDMDHKRETSLHCSEEGK